MNHTDLGTWGEQITAEILETVAPVEPGRDADLRFAGSVEIEVKTARLSKYNGCTLGYQFCIHREGHTSLKAPVLVLIAVTPQLEPAFFVIPADEVGQRRKVAIPANLSGRWETYRDAWDVIAEVN